jgi:hypothetical protein
MDAAAVAEDMPGATHLASGVAYLLLCSARYLDDVGPNHLWLAGETRLWFLGRPASGRVRETSSIYPARPSLICLTCKPTPQLSPLDRAEANMGPCCQNTLSPVG